MKWITGLFKILKGIPSFIGSILEIIALLKTAYNAFRDWQESNRREKFKEGVAEKDTKKVEESFDSDKAGKVVEGVGQIGDLPDEKNK